MKKIIFISILVLFALTAVIAEGSPFYVKSVPITKIYLHRLGYKILFQKSDMNYSTFYVPLSWFTKSAEKGELVVGNEMSYPYFSIFWEDGVFSHIRLYVKEDLNDPTWGELNTIVDLTDKFQIDTLKLEF